MKDHERVRRGNAILDIIQNRYPGVGDQAVTKSMLAEHGRMFWPHTYQGVSDDTEGSEKFSEYIRVLALTDPDKALLLLAALEIPDQIILTIGSCRWFDQGLPVIRLGHKRAA